MVEIHELSAKLHCTETLFSTFQLCFHCLTLMYDLLSPVSPAVLEVPVSELHNLAHWHNQCVSNAFSFPATAFIDSLPVPLVLCSRMIKVYILSLFLFMESGGNGICLLLLVPKPGVRSSGSDSSSLLDFN